MQLFVVSTPERLGEGAELHLQAGNRDSCGQAVLLWQMCVHGLWGQGQGFQLLHPSGLAQPCLPHALPTIRLLGGAVNRI